MTLLALTAFSQTTQIGVMRHGDRADFYPNYQPGAGEQWGNPRLSDKAQYEVRAAALAMFENGFHPTVIFASPFLRTRQTAEIVASVLREKTGKAIQIVIEHAVQETPAGVAHARRGQHHTAPIILPVEGSDETTGPIDDSNDACEQRVLSFFRGLPNLHEAKAVLVVSHGDAVSQMLDNGSRGARYITETAGFFIQEKIGGTWETAILNGVTETY